MTVLVDITDDIDACRELRRVVFIEEQKISEADEYDDRDGDAIHMLARQDGLDVGTARMFIEDDVAKVGRVCVLHPLRGTGIGGQIMEHAIGVARARGAARMKVSSQVHVIPFYRGLGFEPDGPIYDDAGIPHRDMWLSL
ncbi:ElaA protein [Palleronia salina]|uniref:ElaA protein n=2 Tax=Palleronia TaxID=315422 RepID=A0A1M6DD02_9RHOB|nr:MULTISPECIES: GNAT family N-acetyltransferase [Palleronia]SEN30802.1 ElaA protein [Palleronia pelagia]SHI71079.1 ElaA protein [Palleronia salina]